MIKNKLNEYRVTIRRQRKDKIFSDLRKQQHQIKEIEQSIYLLQQIEIRKENFGQFQHLLHSVNQYLIEFSSNSSSKSSMFQLNKQIVDQGNGSHVEATNLLQKQGRRFDGLTSDGFKALVLRLFEEARRECKGKGLNKYWEISDRVLYELTFMTGILIKQPLVLATYFPFKSICQKLPKLSKNVVENAFQSSFEILEKLIFSLKQNFMSSLRGIQQNKITLFLTIIHGLATVIEVFVVNNHGLKARNKMNLTLDENLQRVEYLLTVLKSHNLENCLSKIIKQIDFNDTDNQSEKNILRDQISIGLSILHLANEYWNLLWFMNEYKDSSSFSTAVGCLTTFYLRQMQMKSSQMHQEEINGQISSSKIRMKRLMVIHSICCHPSVMFTTKQVMPLFWEFMCFLLEESTRENTISYDTSNLKLEQNKNLSNLSHFYFVVLVAEEDDKWIHYLQTFIWLQELVDKFDIDIESIIDYVIEQNLQFNEKLLLRLFDSICRSIVNISGHFYNERHLFMEALVKLFAYWGIQTDQNNNYQLVSKQFWIGGEEVLLKTITELEQGIKNNEEIQSLGYKKKQENINYGYKQPQQSTQIGIQPNNQVNYEISQFLQNLKILINQTGHEIRNTNNSFDKEIEFEV